MMMGSLDGRAHIPSIQQYTLTINENEVPNTVSINCFAHAYPQPYKTTKGKRHKF